MDETRFLRFVVLRRFLPQNKNPPVGSGGFDLRYLRLSSSGAVPDFRQNHITPVAKVDYLNKANNAYDDDNANCEHNERNCNRFYKRLHHAKCLISETAPLCNLYIIIVSQSALSGTRFQSDMASLAGLSSPSSHIIDNAQMVASPIQNSAGVNVILESAGGSSSDA